MARSHQFTGLLSVCMAALMLPVGAARADNTGFDLFGRFNSALDAVQEGLDALWPDDVKFKDFRLRVGVGAGAMPAYTGSNNYRFRTLPMIELKYKDLWRLNGTKLTYNLYRKKGLEMGPLVALKFGRSEKERPGLQGMGDISDTFQVGAFVNYRRKGLIATAEFRQALGADQGRTLRATLGHGLYKTEKAMLGFAVRGKWMSNHAMQTNFGVTEAQAEANTGELTSFVPGSGFSELSGNLVGAYRLSDKWRLLGLVSYTKLVGSAGDSPITNGIYGSNTQIIAGSALNYQF